MVVALTVLALVLLVLGSASLVLAVLFVPVLRVQFSLSASLLVVFW